MMMNRTRGTLDFGPYRLESEPYRLWRGSEQIALRPKSLKVLAYLARRPGHLVTKEELREQVWGTRHVSDTRLRVTVHEVRAALGDGQHGPEYLETVPGRGYRFVTTSETSELDDARSTLDVPLRGGPGPVVGRGREMEYLVNRLREAERGERRLIFLSGEPGVGKTTLVNRFLEHLTGRSHTICAVGQCVMHHGSGEAYAPVLEALGRLGQDGSRHDLIWVLERCAPMWLVQLPALVDSEELEQLQHQVWGATRERMVRELNDALEQLTAKHTLVLILEDLHWTDSATVDLLTSIAQRTEPARLLIVATYRPAEAIVSAPDFRTMVHELEARGLCEHFDLELLTPGAVAAYVSARFGGEDTQDVATAVYERSDGNALFMVNLFEHLAEKHAIRWRNHRWVVDVDSAALTQIPNGLRPFIDRRLDTLSGEDRDLLEAASVVGVEFSAAAVGAGWPRSGEEQLPPNIELRLESLVKHAQLIVPCGTIEWPDGTLSSCYRFGHALYRDGLYQQIPEARRVRLHRRVGEWLQKTWGEDSREMAAVLANHFEQGRDAGNAARYRRLAGERALGQHAYHEAAGHLQAALEAFDQPHSGPAEGDPEDRARWELEVCTALGTALIVTRGQSDTEVGKAHSRALSVLDCLNDPVAELQILFNLWTFSSAAADLTECANLVTRMSELAAGTENDEVALASHCAGARTALFRGKLAESADSAQRVFALYDPLRHSDLVNRTYNDEAGVSSLGADAWRLWLQGFPAQAMVRARAACELAERLHHPFSRAYALNWLIGTLQFRGETVQLERRISDVHGISAEHGFSLWSAWATCLSGWVAGARADVGDEADGIALMERGLDAWRGAGTRILEPYLLALLSETCLRAGRIDAASERLAEARDRVEKTGERWWEAELHRLEGEILLTAACDGDERDRAEACFRRALEVAGRQGATSLELRAALSLSRLGNSPDAHQLLGEIVGRFTEGHDTADLRAAQTQLSAIQPPA
jgi:DNA-binding winged helix-turn-helix (wHTH) protein/predicted ATPase